MNAVEQPAETTASNPGMPIILGVALMLCAGWMMVWRSSLDGVFHFDDYSNIVDNERIRQLWPLDDFLSNNRPIGLYSFALNYHFGGSEPYSYHVVNLLIHVLNAMTLFVGGLLVERLYRRHWCDDPKPKITYGMLGTSAIIATAWCVHPLTTQAVTNIVQRYESLTCMGYLGVWLGMLIYLDGKRWLGCLMILPMAWIGLMSKEVFATAPLAVVLLDRLLTRQNWVSILKQRCVPIALMLSPMVWFVPSVLRFFDTSTEGSSMGFGMKNLTSWEYLRTQPEVIWHYLSLVVWPEQLGFDYLWRIQNNPLIYLPLGCTIVGLVIAGGYLYWRGAVRNQSFASGLAGWLLLTFFFILAPTSTIVPIIDMAVEHRMYLPTAVVVTGITLAGRALAAKLLRTSDRPAILRAGLASFVIAIVGMLGWRTHLRNLDYRDGLILWQTAIDASPKNPRAWYQLGLEHFNRGRREDALPMMVNAVGFSNTSFPIFDAGLAECLNNIGRVDEALTLYQRALAKKPNYKEVHNNLGAIYMKRSQIELAKASFEAAANLGDASAAYNLGFLHFKQQQFADAIPYFNETLRRDPDFSLAALRLSFLYATASDDDVHDFDRAENLFAQYEGDIESSSPWILDTAAVIEAARDRFDEAMRLINLAIERAKAADELDEALIDQLKQRLTAYENGERWQWEAQP